MCFVKKLKEGEFERLHVTVKCRDYFGDILQSEFTNDGFKMYGFTTEPESYRIDRDATRLYINFPDKEIAHLFKQNFHILETIEKENGLVQSVWFDVSENEIIIESDSLWLSSIFSNSLYTFLLKCLCYQYMDNNWIKALTKENWTGSEVEYAKRITEPKLTRVLKNLKPLLVPLCNPSGWHGSSVSEDKVHNNSGFYTILVYGGKAIIPTCNCPLCQDIKSNPQPNDMIPLLKSIGVSVPGE